MNSSVASTALVQDRLGFGDGRLYLVTAAMVLGNVLLPFAFHQVPNGGRIFLPVFFFTLIAGWRFGLAAGLLTALLSPVASHFLTGMPGIPKLPAMILHSALLAALAAVVAGRGRRTSLFLIGLVVIVQQTLLLFPVLLLSGPQVCLTAVKTRIPGLLLQIFGGFLVLRLLERFLPVDSARSSEA